MRYLSIVIICLFFLGFPAVSADLLLPINAPVSTQPASPLPISEKMNGLLNIQLSQHPTWKALIDRKKMAVGLVDLSDPQTPHAAWVNENVMMYAASLPKITILMAACQAMENGELEENVENIQTLKNMIRMSSNTAAADMVKKIGGVEKVDAMLKNPQYGLFDTTTGGLWLGNGYSHQTTSQPDPLHGLIHAATVAQVCKFYYLMTVGQMINPKRSAQMLDIMSHPGIAHKFIYALRGQVPEDRLFRKSGTWQGWHADSVMVWGKDPKQRFILVGLVEDPKGEDILRQLVPAAEKVLKGT